MWILVLILSVFYFISQNKYKQKNDIAVEKSKLFLENQIPFKQNDVLEEQYRTIEETGFNSRVLAVYKPIKTNLDFSDSLYKTNNYEWKYLKLHLIDSFYSYAKLKKDNTFLNYQNPSSSTIADKLHKLSLYRLYSKYHLMDFNNISYCGAFYSKCQLFHLFDRSHIGLFYNYENNLSSSKIYQDNRIIEKLYFDIKKDTTIYFKIHIDYNQSNISSTTTSYKLEIKAGQRNDFDIKEIK